MCGGFWNNPIQSTSDTVSHVGQVVADSPIAQAVITVGGAMVGVPPMVTAGILGANQTSNNGGDLVAGLTTGALSYLGGTGVNNYMDTGSLLGGAPNMGGGTGLTLGSGGQTGLTGSLASSTGYGLDTAGTSLASMGGGTGISLGSTAAGGSSSGLGGLWNTVTSTPNLIRGGMELAGSYMNNRAASDAASTQADAQIRAAQIAADAAKFRPIGVTTNFGSSQFGYDSNGNLNSAGYALNPVLQGQQNQLLGASQGMLNQFTGSQAATAPMGDAAQRMMSLGNQYLQTSPQQQAATYLQQQQGLLAPGRASAMADLQAKMQAQGRGGFAIGGGVNGQGAANPQMQALYNAQMQQDALLASQATQGGMDYARFGGAMVGGGGQMLRDQYGTQSAAYAPYQTALGGAQTIEGLGQNALTLGMDMGSTNSNANAKAGLLTGQGITNAAATMAPTNAYSPWGTILSGAGSMLGNYKWGT